MALVAGNDVLLVSILVDRLLPRDWVQPMTEFVLVRLVSCRRVIDGLPHHYSLISLGGLACKSFEGKEH